MVPRGPVGEYDHGHLYLPEYVPPSAPEACRPLGRWWISPSFEFAWLPVTARAGQRPAPRARLPEAARFPARSSRSPGNPPNTFQGGFGLTGGWWFNDRNTRGVDASFFTVSGGDYTFNGFAPGMLVLFPDGSTAPRRK